MALIESFEERPLTPAALHRPVTCGYKAVDIGGQRVLQLETYGSSTRKLADKVSQSIQLDVEGARALKRILERSFTDL